MHVCITPANLNGIGKWILEEMGEGAGPGRLQGFVAGMCLHALIQRFFLPDLEHAVCLLICWK